MLKVLLWILLPPLLVRVIPPLLSALIDVLTFDFMFRTLQSYFLAFYD